MALFNRWGALGVRDDPALDHVAHDLLNVRNGTLDLQSGQLRPHSPADLHSRLAPVEFDPLARCPLFERFLDGVFGGDAALIECVARILRSTLTGITRDQVFFPLVGRGANGETTLMQTLVRLLGDYAHEFNPDTIMVKAHERIAVDIADLHNVRLALTSESDGTQRLHEGKIKRMTGGEQLTGERKFEHPFSFWPHFKLFLVTNHLPRIQGTDTGIWRRVMPLPFEQTFWTRESGESGPPHLEADPLLGQKLQEELPGILNWLLAGSLRWQSEGLLWPDKVQGKKASYRAEEDELAPFLDAVLRHGWKNTNRGGRPLLRLPPVVP